MSKGKGNVGPIHVLYPLPQAVVENCTEKCFKPKNKKKINENRLLLELRDRTNKSYSSFLVSQEFKLIEKKSLHIRLNLLRGRTWVCSVIQCSHVNGVGNNVDCQCGILLVFICSSIWNGKWIIVALRHHTLKPIQGIKCSKPTAASSKLILWKCHEHSS